MHRPAVERATLDGLTQLGNHRAFQAPAAEMPAARLAVSTV